MSKYVIEEVPVLSEENIKIKMSIRQLLYMLDECPDEPKRSEEFVVYLRSFLKIKSRSLPTIEVMTLIKHHKPIIFSKLRKMAPYNLMLEILTELSTDIRTATENLEKYLKDTH